MKKFSAPFDPNERKDYVRDWTAEMNAVTDTITSATFTLPASAIAAGLRIDFTQISSDNKKAVFWLMSDDPEATRAALLDKEVAINHHVTTVGGRQYDETLIVKVKEK